MENNIEIWKDIPDYEGFYQVSNLGNVRSLDRVVVNSLGYKKLLKGKIIKNSIDIRRYKGVRIPLSKNKKTKRFVLSRLVASIFIPNPENKPKVLHKDDDPTNNHFSNLFWGTSLENSQDALNKNRLKLDNLSDYHKEIKKKSTSKYVGVYWNKSNKKWRAVFNKPGNSGRIHLGYFTDEYEAHLAYQKKLKEIND